MLLGVAALAALLLEVAFVSISFDARALLQAGNLSPLQRAFASFGILAEIGVLALVVAALLLKDRLLGYWLKLEDSLASWRFVIFLSANLLCYGLFFLSSRQIFGADAQAAELTNVTLVAWLILGIFTLIFWAFSLASPRLLKEFLGAEYLPLGISVGIALGVWLVSLGTQSLWGPLSEGTFRASAFLLALLEPESLVVIPNERTLGLGNFVVNVAAACSGYEGIGLVSAFTALYLYLYRQELRFPHVYWLFPVGATAIWVLNSVRIATLVAIGHYWSPDVAVGGFHSQAGWMTFILASLLIIWLVGGSAFFRKADVRVQRRPMNTAAAALVPLVSLLAVSLLSSALSADFDWLYPLRVAAVAVALFVVRSQIPILPYQLRWEPLLAGLFVAAMWVALVGSDDTYNQSFSNNLSAAPPLWAGLWLLFRFVGTSVTVPIAEELAFRGYLLCRLSRTSVVIRGKLPFSAIAVAVSSLAFGVLHGAWIAGTVAGVVYALVRLRSNSITDAIVAHAVTNTALFILAAMSGNWFLL